jgi:hypothetical protein
LRGALAILLLLVVLGLVVAVRAVFRSFDFTCEVCVTHGGRTVCREAVGSAPGEARAIALERACAFLATDRADRTACVESSPLSVDCRAN